MQEGAERTAAAVITLELIRREHERCRVDQPHVFVLITDDAVPVDVLQGLRDSEIVVCAENEVDSVGAFLARSKLGCY